LYILIPEQMGRNVTFVYGIRMIHRGGEFRGAKRRFRSAMGLRVTLPESGDHSASSPHLTPEL
jgi:hypothetical protein